MDTDQIKHLTLVHVQAQAETFRDICGVRLSAGSVSTVIRGVRLAAMIAAYLHTL